MKALSFITVAGFGMAAGATVALMLPRQCTARQALQKAADAAQDAVFDAADHLMRA